MPNADVVTHNSAVPLLGGIGIIAATSLSALFMDTSEIPLLAILGILVLSAMGLYKDITRHDLSPLLQMIVQCMCCTVLLLAVDSWSQLPWWPLIAAVLIGVSIINAVNFIDVSDGLCAAATMPAFFGLYWAGANSLTLGIAGALLGFFFWNRPKARVFMGDVGSFFLGGMLCLTLMDGILAQRWHPAILLLVAVPCAELLMTIAIRLSRARSITRGDASHVSLILLNAGCSPWTLVFLFGGTSLVFCLVVTRFFA